MSKFHHTWDHFLLELILYIFVDPSLSEFNHFWAINTPCGDPFHIFHTSYFSTSRCKPVSVTHQNYFIFQHCLKAFVAPKNWMTRGAPSQKKHHQLTRVQGPRRTWIRDKISYDSWNKASNTHDGSMGRGRTFTYMNGWFLWFSCREIYNRPMWSVMGNKLHWTMGIMRIEGCFSGKPREHPGNSRTH